MKRPVGTLSTDDENATEKTNWPGFFKQPCLLVPLW